MTRVSRRGLVHDVHGRSNIPFTVEQLSGNGPSVASPPKPPQQETSVSNTFNRRSFLRRSGLTVAGLAVLGGAIRAARRLWQRRRDVDGHHRGRRLERRPSARWATSIPALVDQERRVRRPVHRRHERLLQGGGFSAVNLMAGGPNVQPGLRRRVGQGARRHLGAGHHRLGHPQGRRPHRHRRAVPEEPVLRS